MYLTEGLSEKVTSIASKNQAASPVWCADYAAGCVVSVGMKPT